MSKKYLISSEVNGTETFFTADTDGTITAIGTVINWDYGFDDLVLKTINNSTYATLKNGKIYVNTDQTNIVATENDVVGGLLLTTDDTAVDCKGYSGINYVTVASSDNCKFLLSFDGRKTWYNRGEGTMASSTVAIPTTAAARTSAGIDIPEGSENAFDGNINTNITLASEDIYQTVEFTTPIKARSHKIYLGLANRFPCTVTFEVYDIENSKWVQLDKIIIKASKEINRYFDNKISSNSYRWHFEFDPTSFGDDPEKDLVIVELNTYGETTGTTWTKCDLEDISTKGISKASINAISGATNYVNIFDQTQLDYAVYIPKGETFTSLSVGFPANAAPTITDFMSSPDSLHSENEIISFYIEDPEGKTCHYNIYVNEELVISNKSVASGTSVEETIPNITLTVANGLNVIKIVAFDDYDAKNTYISYVTKVDRLPGYTGILVDNTYTINITDEDMDQVKITAKLNGKIIEVTELREVPYSHKIIMSTNDINIGKDNTLLIQLMDSVGGITTVEEHFVGDYYGLIFTNEAGTLLSSDIGVILSKLDLGTIVCGQQTLPVLVKVINKSSNNIKNIVVTSPRDINGEDIDNYDGDVYIGTTHIDGDVFVQFSEDDSFEVPNNFYSLTLKNLASKESTSFFVRVISQNKSAKGFTMDFDVNATAVSD